MKNFFISVATLLIGLTVNATVVLNKKDLKLFNTIALRQVNNIQMPTRIELGTKGQTLIKLFLEKNNQLEALSFQPFDSSTCPLNNWHKISVNSSDEKLEIRNSSGTYTLEAEVKCGYENHLIFKLDSPEGELISLWNVLFLAKKFFTDIQRLNFWKNKITVLWPAQGDFYSNVVNITKGNQWDVVAHELGHAIYDQAEIGHFGSGPHKIDECYNSTLALSEGWATFFAAWIKLDINDSDPKFEYLVPRRAPIQIENVPNDVCRGVENEWRVASYLWDIIDNHSDIQGEEAHLDSAKIWDHFENKKYLNIEDFKIEFDKDSESKSLNDVLWNLNF